MSNSFFHFKQFTIHQERCAMKVGTDGVLLGAWVAINNAEHILDIGTGTGLIALMLAQRSAAQIDAIEIDADAANQAKENVQLSQWKERICVYKTSLQDYWPEAKSYDLIVTNPPYFSNSLPAPDPGRNIARHNYQLSLHELLEGVRRLLKKNGRLGIILPVEVFNTFVEKAVEIQLFPLHKTLIKPSPHKSAIRIMAEFSYIEKEISTSDLFIEKYGRHRYSEEYIDLTRDFYLKL